MRVDINPFYSRFSNVDSDDNFIKLFSPEILNIYLEYPIWSAVNILRSSPGGGKTTLLKIFSPKILNQIKDSLAHDLHARELHAALKKVDIFDEKGNPKVAAGISAFNTEYNNLEYLDLPESQKLRLFCSLLNIRIILSTFKSICAIRNIEYPTQLSRITFSEVENLALPIYIRTLTSAEHVHKWAIVEEEKIFEQLDSIYSDVNENLKGSDSLFALDLLSSRNLLIDSKKLDLKIVVMLDDVHNLSVKQRSFLIKTIVDKRSDVNVWIAERLKALSPLELFSEGSKTGRDLNLIELEKFWSRKNIQFEKFSRSVANRRVELAFETPRDFASFLSEKMPDKYSNVIEDAIGLVMIRVKKRYGNLKKYQPWIRSKMAMEFPDRYDELIEWRSLEILLFRDKNKNIQTSAFEDPELDVEVLEQQQGSDVRTAAQLFVNEEFKIPFYYGIGNICRLASSNIEQFLNIAGELFDIVLENSIKKIVNPSLHLTLAPDKQEEVIKRIVNDKWRDLDTSIPNVNEVKKFIDAIGEFCYAETHVSNAWNSPGINGIAITMSERTAIQKIYLNDKAHHYHKISKVLSICLANNILDFKLNYKCKGKEWMVIYINRIYCVKYHLPLNNGKFKEKKIKDLASWVDVGFNAQKKLNV